MLDRILRCISDAVDDFEDGHSKYESQFYEQEKKVCYRRNNKILI